MIHLSYILYFLLYEYIIYLAARQIGDGNGMEGAFNAVLFWVIAQLAGVGAIVVVHFGWLRNLKIGW